MGLKKMKARGVNASSWDKINAREANESLANRDVFGDQQLDRSTRAKRRSPKWGYIGAGVLAAVVTVVAWVLYSVIVALLVAVSGGLSGMGDSGGQGSNQDKEYYTEVQQGGEGGSSVTCYRALEENGSLDLSSECHASPEDVPVPEWAEPVDTADEEPAEEPTEAAASTSVGEQLRSVSGQKLLLTLGAGAVVGLTVGGLVSRRVRVENLMNTTDDINQHHNDQHIALPEEIQRKFDIFPDAGAHSSVQVSSVISHMMLKKKGLGTVDVVERAESDILDEDGEVVYYKGEALEDEDGNLKTRQMPLIDEKFGHDLFEASGLPDIKSSSGKPLRRFFDATAIEYKPKAISRDKLGEYKTLAELINDDWTFPDYEVQRPAGAYVVDTAPVNTMVLAITRGGKGQTYIEPTLDMWSREEKPSNMVINDPKGELLVKNYIPFVRRGFEPVQFNLINPPKTNIYNPLGMAADAAREGDSMKCAQYVENIADVFFPMDGGEDPVWPNAANNAFKRAAYGLIDYYLEEERELRDYAASTGMSPEDLAQRLDEIWGRVTLYNCYQLFVQLSSKKMKNPMAEVDEQIKAGKFGDDEAALEEARANADAQAFLWEGKAEQDMLTLYFNATEALPSNSMRNMIDSVNNALRTMASAEKMLASVYGIAITAMSFFTDPTISRLTSGRPSQTTDFGSLSFPRRIGVRFSQNFLKREHLWRDVQAIWSAYSDSMFTQNLGKTFEHEDVISPEGWARYYFEGKFPTDEAYIKLELVDAQSQMLLRTFYFHFKKSYQLSLNGRHFIEESVTGQKIIKDGVLRELKPVRAGGTADGEIVGFKAKDTMYPQARLDLTSEVAQRVAGEARAVTQTMVRYSEMTKAVFLVTPPHLMKYAKIVLILIKQLVDLNFDKSYMTKSSQKPLYRTRFMLDELGNLQSEGTGISGFETMLSIGLGQEQQFTIILQTLQQLRDVYGESVDQIVQGNTSNIVFLKSTDDQMIEKLEKMSGKTHRSYRDSKTVTQNMNKMIGGKTDGNVSYNDSTQEEALITYNDMYFISPNQSIVFRAGDAPVWNRNETILPMAHRLLRKTIKHGGREGFTLQTIPTLSTAADFDVRNNQPDFVKMLNKRIRQGVRAKDAKTRYQDAYGYSDIEIARLDSDIYSDEVMEIITMLIMAEEGKDPNAAASIDPDDIAASMMFDEEQFLEDTQLAAEVHDLAMDEAERARPIYAEGTVSRDMLVHRNKIAKVKTLDLQLGEAYKSALVEMQRDHQNFSVGGDGELRSADGSKTYISPIRSSSYAEAAQRLNGDIEDEDSRVFAEQDITEQDLQSLMSVKIHAAFYQFLASLDTWEHLADGEFDRAMAIEMRLDDSD